MAQNTFNAVDSDLIDKSETGMLLCDIAKQKFLIEIYASIYVMIKNMIWSLTNP